MKIKIFTANADRPFFYNDSKRTAEWLCDPEAKSTQDLVNEFLEQVKPIQVFVSEDPISGVLVTTIVYEDKEKNDD